MKLEIVKSRRKTMSLQVLRPDILRVRVPYACREFEISRFIDKNQQWINKQLAQYKAYPGIPDSRFEDGGQLWLFGERYDVRVVPGDSFDIKLNETSLVVTRAAKTDEQIRRKIQQWKRDFTEVYFSERLAELHQSAPVSLPGYSFKIRKMKRQWGNCSRRGQITLSTALVRYPLECIDYVMWHELTHLKHFNHSASFYRLQEVLCPNWREYKMKLERFSP